MLERSEHTCGSTWHAAGAMHTFNTDPNVAKLQDCTLKIDKEIEEVSGHSCAIHLTGGLMLADTQDRLDDLNTARGRYLGLDTEFVDLEECALRPQRRPHRPLGGDPRLRRRGPQGRRRDLPGDPSGGPEPARRRHLGRGDGEGHPARGRSGPRRCTPSSAPPSSTTSTRRPSSPMCLPASPSCCTPVCKSCCPGTGKPPGTRPWPRRAALTHLTRRLRTSPTLGIRPHVPRPSPAFNYPQRRFAWLRRG